MKKMVKLICADDNNALRINPKRVVLVAKLGNRIQVSSGNFAINVKASWDEIRKLFRARGFIELLALSNKASVLANAANVLEWHEQDGGVFLEFGGGGYVVDGTLEEVTAKIEKALEGERSKG